MSNTIDVHIPPNASLNGESSVPKKEKAEPIIEKLRQAEKLLGERAKEDIIYSPALVSLYDTPIFKQGTINIIQGKFGVHKSRLAELFVSLIIQADATKKLLGFKRYAFNTYTVCLVDTERNLKEELPNAIQNIKLKAGYEKTDDISNFRFTSLKKIERKSRLNALLQYLQEVRKSTDNHLFILLDVVTDCVSSFNRDEESMLLFDKLGNMCEDQNATFLLLIHENFGSEKARGHVGSEAANKASCVMQISFEMNGGNQPTDLIKLRFIKLRGAKKPEPIFLRYSKAASGLIVAEPDMIQTVMQSKQQKAGIEAIKLSLLELVQGQELGQKDLIKALKEEHGASNNTIKKRLDEIEKLKIPVTNNESEKIYYLIAKREAGKQTIYKLEQTQPTQPK